MILKGRSFFKIVLSVLNEAKKAYKKEEVPIGAIIVKDYNDFDVIDRHIDFDNVNKILNKEREKAEKYLKQVAIEVKKVSD